MKKYYAMAIERGDVDSMHNMGYYYANTKIDINKMQYYYTVGAMKGDKHCKDKLTFFYCTNKDFAVNTNPLYWTFQF